MTKFPEIPESLPEPISAHVELLRRLYDRYIFTSKIHYTKYFRDQAAGVAKQAERILNDPDRSLHTSGLDTSDRDD